MALRKLETTKKALPKKGLTKVPKIGVYRRDEYTGKVVGESHPTVKEWVMIPIQDRPHSDWFPEVDAERVPPETFYVFSKPEQKLLFMASRDAEGVTVAWETDRDGKYFLRSRKPLWAPRSIELFYDQSRVIKEEGKAAWNPAHKDWTGSLSRTVKRDTAPWVPPTRTVRESPSQDVTGASKGMRPLRRRSEVGSSVKPDKSTPKPLPKVRKSLPKRKPVDDGGILTHKGLDQKKLSSAADDMAGKYTSAFPSGDGKRRPMKKLRRK